MEHFALGYCFSKVDIFKNFPSKKLKYDRKKIKEIYGDIRPKNFAWRIFVYGLYIILLDIIHNGITFQFPTKKDVCIHMESITGEEFKKIRRGGGFLDVDYLKSNFTGNHLVYSRMNKDREVKKDIHVNRGLKELITKYTNEGRGYS